LIEHVALSRSAAYLARLPLSVTISCGDHAKTDSETTQLALKAAAEAARQRLPSSADGDAARKYIPSLAHCRQTRLYRVVPPVFLPGGFFGMRHYLPVGASVLPPGRDNPLWRSGFRSCGRKSRGH